MHLQPRYDIFYFHKVFNTFLIQKLTITLSYFLTVLAIVQHVPLYNVFILVLTNMSQCVHVIQEEKCAEKSQSVCDDPVSS